MAAIKGQIEITEGKSEYEKEMLDKEVEREKSFTLLSKDTKFIDYIKGNHVYWINIGVMMISWACSSFCFYLVPYFLAHSLGRSGNLNVFQLSLSQYTGEFFACLLSVALARFMPSSKLALALSHSLTVVAAVLFLCTDETQWTLQLISLFLCRFGVTTAFNLSYTIMRELFETLVRTTSFGICNVTARAITITAPVIAISAFPIPMIVVAVFSAVAGSLSMFTRPRLHLEESFKDIQNE